MTLRCLASAVRPSVSRSTTPDLKARSLSRSIDGVPNETPCEPGTAASATTRAAWSSAFDGMQPTLRQTPPSFVRLDQDHGRAEVRGAERGGVAAGAGAEDEKVAGDVGAGRRRTAPRGEEATRRSGCKSPLAGARVPLLAGITTTGTARAARSAERP